MKNKLLLGALSLLSAAAQAQIANPGFADSTSGVRLDKVHISGYLDTYLGIGKVAPWAVASYTVWF
jgi:hypothetical protein